MRYGWLDGWIWKGHALEIWNVTSRTLGSAVLEMGWDVVMVVWWNKNFCVGFVVLKIRCRKERTVVMAEA